jgi:hypothetical protein
MVELLKSPFCLMIAWLNPFGTWCNAQKNFQYSHLSVINFFARYFIFIIKFINQFVCIARLRESPIIVYHAFLYHTDVFSNRAFGWNVFCLLKWGNKVLYAIQEDKISFLTQQDCRLFVCLFVCYFRYFLFCCLNIFLNLKPKVIKWYSEHEFAKIQIEDQFRCWPWMEPDAILRQLITKANKFARSWLHKNVERFYEIVVWMSEISRTSLPFWHLT